MNITWWSIEARDGYFSAYAWQNAYAQSLAEAAITNGAVEWNWTEATFGVVFEVAFADDEAWYRFRQLPLVVAALDAVPAELLYVYPGRGGTAGAGRPRQPRPIAGAGGAELPEEPPPVIVARPEILERAVA
jgi:hypothetical protein